MKLYQIDASGLGLSDRLSIDRQIIALGYIYTPVPDLDHFVFYADPCDSVSERLTLPNGCTLTESG